MRKIAVAFFALVALFVFASCSNETQEPVFYTVTFVSDGGSDVASQLIEQGQPASKPEDPTKAGYKFVGWYTDQKLSIPYDFNTPVTENITLYPKWEAESIEAPEGSYKVTFETDGGSAVPEQVVEEGKLVTKPEDPTKAGYKFIGWYMDLNSSDQYDFTTPVTSNTTLYAKWEAIETPAKSFTVTFNSLGGSAVNSITVEDGKTITLPSEAPVKEGYDFTGWFTDEKCTTEFDANTIITKDITLYAGWKAKEAATSPLYGTWESTENLTIYDSAFNAHEAKLYISFNNDQMVVYFPYNGSTNYIPYTYDQTAPSAIVLNWNENGQQMMTFLTITDSGIQFYPVIQVSVTQGILATSSVTMKKVSSSFDLYPNMPTKPFESPNDWFTFKSYGDGYMVEYFRGDESVTDVVIPSTYNGLPVIRIGSSAFSNEYSIRSVIIPDSVTSIGAYAFDNCRNFESVEMSENITTIGNYAFRDCINLKSIEIPAPVTSLGYNAFEGCSDLERVTFHGEGLTLLDYQTFMDCTSLMEIEIPSSVTELGYSVFSGCSSLTRVKLPENLLEISDACFSDCSSLTEFNIPSTIKTIEYRTFANCTSLRELFVPSTVERVYCEAFDGCSNLTVKFDFAEGEGRIHSSGAMPSLYDFECNVEYTYATISFNSFGGSKIGNVYAKKGFVASAPTEDPIFEGAIFDGWYTDISCTTPFDFNSPVNESVVLYAGWDVSDPSSVILNDGTYRYKISDDKSYVIVSSYVSGSIEEGDAIELPATVQKLPVKAIGSGFGKSLDDWVTEFTVPSFINELEDNAFSNSKLSKVVFSKNIEKLGNYTFNGSKKLTEVVFPEGWKTISDFMFYACDSLVALTLPESVEYIGGYWAGGSGITTINIPASIKEVGESAFGSLTISSSENVENLEKIGARAFASTEGFNGIINFKRLKSVGDMAFTGVKGIEGISFNEGVEEIEDQAFRYDGGSIIQSLTMPSSLKTVGSYVLPANVEKVIVNWPDGVKPEGWDNFWMGSLRDDQIEINSI